MKKIHIWIVIALVALIGLSVLVGNTNQNLGGSTSDNWNVGGNLTVAGTSTVTGASTLTGNTTVTGNLFVDGTLTADGFLNEVSTVTVDTVLTAADSGKTIYAGTAGVDVTLPAPAAGLNYRMVVSANFATTSMLLQGPAADATDDKIFGSLEVAGAVVLCAAEDTITFVNSAELPGDWVEVHSDGTNWYISGQAGTSGGITCSDAD